MWSPEGQEILFTRLFVQEPGLWRKPAFGAGEAQKVVEREYMSWATHWSRDGTIGFYHQHPVTGRDVWVQSPGEGPVLVAGTRANERSPWFSPDGRLLAHVSDESGRPSVYVEPFPSTGEKWLVSPDGGEGPVWSRDGRELFYRRGRAMMSVPVEASASFSFGAPRVPFEGSFEVATGGRNQNYDVAPDGRFLMIQRLDPESPREIRVVLNRTEELKRLLPRTR